MLNACLVTQLCSTLCNPMGCSPLGSTVHGDSPGKNIGVGCHAHYRESSQPRDRTQVSLIAVRFFTIWATAKSLQSCPTLCNPRDSSPPGSPVPGILQARTLRWVAISFSNAWKWKAKVKLLSRVWLLATPWTAAHQAPLPMGFSRQERWSGVPLPSPMIIQRKWQIDSRD